MREEACSGGATMPQPWTLRLTRNESSCDPVDTALSLVASRALPIFSANLWAERSATLNPKPAWSSLMGLLRPHRAVAPAPRAPTDARGDHDPLRAFCDVFRQLQNAKFVDSTLG